MKKIRTIHRKNKKGEFTSWEYKFETASIDGSRKWVSKGGYKTEIDAYNDGLKAFEDYNNAGQVINPAKISVADMLNLWVKDYCTTNLKLTTTTGYLKRIKNHINPYIGKYSINTIRLDALQNIINTLFQKGYSRNTMSTVKGILNKSFMWAYKNGYLKKSPAIGLELPLITAVPKHGTTRKKNRVYIEKSVIKELFERFPENEPDHIPLIFAYRLGMRWGECFAVTWDNIDFKEHTLTVEKQIQYDERNNQLFFTMPKYNSVRVLPLDDETYNLLRRTKLKQDKARIYYGEYFTHYYINSDRYITDDSKNKELLLVNIRDNGTFVRPRTIQNVGQVMIHKLNYPQFDFHSLRHTHCADLIDAGVNINTVKLLMGHKNINTTLDVYDHMTENRKQETNNIIKQMYK